MHPALLAAEVCVVETILIFVGECIRTSLYSHLGNESVRKVDFYGLTIALTKT